MEILIGRNIKQFRRAMEISQERLAEATGVTVQAVSKWETCQSLPDIGLVPEIAAFFGVTIDELFFGKGEYVPKTDISVIPNNGKLYIVQAMNGKILGSDEWIQDKRIYLELNENGSQPSLEIWGSADINGNVSGVTSKGSVNCGNVSGGVVADGSVNCGNVSGGIVADGSVNCGHVGGSVTTDNSINCGHINGAVYTQGDIRCGNITECKEIRCNKLYAKGKINCGKIEGEVHTGEDIDFDY